MVDHREDKTDPQEAPRRQAAADKREHGALPFSLIGIAIVVLVGGLFAWLTSN